MRSRVLALPLVALALAVGCSGDVAGQLTTNAELKDRVLSTIAANPTLAAEMFERVMAVDSTRSRLLEGMLQNDIFAQHLLTRVATTPGAVDAVIGMAAQDSAMREHVVTLVKGMSRAGGGTRIP